jgi:hypothetical protein
VSKRTKPTPKPRAPEQKAPPHPPAPSTAPPPKPPSDRFVWTEDDFESGGVTIE